MRITFAVDGGFAVFPGLARPVTIEVDALPAADAAALRGLVERARFFDCAEPHAPAARGIADQRRHVVTIDDGGRHRTLTVPEASDDGALAALVGVLERHRRRPRVP